MPAEMWFRNPERWMPVLVDAGATRVVWHKGLTIKRSIDPVAHARLYFPASTDWRVMSVGAQGVLEWTQDSAGERDPVACYPIWQYGEPFEELEALCEANIAEEPAARLDPYVDPIFRPRRGQEHRVVIGSYPKLNSGPGRRLLVLLGDLQRDHPDTIIHLFSATTLGSFLTTGLRSGDYDPRTLASCGRIVLPNGRMVTREKFNAFRQWINLVGYSSADLTTAADLLRFNIQSALYAAEHWDDSYKFRSLKAADLRGYSDETPLGELPAPVSTRHAVYLGKPAPGDKVACDHCTLANSCKHYREGSVCNLTQSDTAGLAHFFKTRDANRIIDGLGELLAVQARRAESALAIEQEGDELDSELTRVLQHMFDGGVKLAKLANPALAAASAPKIAVQINNGGQIQAANPSALMAGLVRELESRGIDRAEITPEMVLGLIEPPKDDNVIEAREVGS